MANVMMPQRKQDNTLGNVLQLGGAIAGGIAGGAATGGAGAAAGATAGSTAMGVAGGAVTGGSAGGMLAGFADRPKTEVAPVGGGNAMQRRYSALAPMNPDQYAPQLAAAEQAAMQLPKDQQAMYLPAIQRARSMNGGMA